MRSSGDHTDSSGISMPKTGKLYDQQGISDDQVTSSASRGSYMAEAGASAILLGHGPQPRRGRTPVHGHWSNCLQEQAGTFKFLVTRCFMFSRSCCHQQDDIRAWGVVGGLWLPTWGRTWESSRALSKQKELLQSRLVLVPVTTMIVAH